MALTEPRGFGWSLNEASTQYQEALNAAIMADKLRKASLMPKSSTPSSANDLLPDNCHLRIDLSIGDVPTVSEMSRFLDKVTGSLGASTSECNRWLAKTVGGPRYKRGNMHGMFWYHNAMKLCHRLVYNWFVGDPGDLEVTHTCSSDGNCVNPCHLQLRSSIMRMTSSRRTGPRTLKPPPPILVPATFAHAIPPSAMIPVPIASEAIAAAPVATTAVAKRGRNADSDSDWEEASPKRPTTSRRVQPAFSSCATRITTSATEGSQTVQSDEASLLSFDSYDSSNNDDSPYDPPAIQPRDPDMFADGKMPPCLLPSFGLPPSMNVFSPYGAAFRSPIMTFTPMATGFSSPHRLLSPSWHSSMLPSTLQYVMPAQIYQSPQVQVGQE
eukprot:TRINITY_DN2326_c0_g2_i2.p1 TRINITY_DN2326_c0_g2~~TRINITY_DN2326_c0_g2_i2.p1  ORF type:complete len:394 (-),score=39.16 TRINITY_DN2326_c0_g2_i2:21-1172(-)